MHGYNSGERGGLKQYLKNKIPHLIWVGCGNHKLALCFFLELLWKFFKPLAKNLLEKSAEMYDENVVVPIAQSVTRWTTHEHVCKLVIKDYRQFILQ